MARDTSNPPQFTQRENDSESALMHYRARSYDQRTGRFTGRDPIDRLSLQLSGYVYVGNNPLTNVDPLGLFKVETHKKITREVLKGTFNVDNEDFILGKIANANAEQDNHQFTNKYHYDSSKFEEANQFVEEQYAVIRETTRIHDAFEAFGKILHARQDFYSHSIYVEAFLFRNQNQDSLETETYENKLLRILRNNNDSPDDIPVWDFKKTKRDLGAYGSEEGYFAFGCVMHSGGFPWHITPKHHEWINKDAEEDNFLNVGPGPMKNAKGFSMHLFARKAAEKQTKVEWERFKLEVAKNKNGDLQDSWKFVQPGAKKK